MGRGAVHQRATGGDPQPKRLSRDALHAARMGYCGPRGIALSVFLSWPIDDQDAALTWASHEAARCGSCGHHPDEPARHLHVDVCPGCVVLQRTQAGEDVKARGARLRAASGTPAQCPRCTADAPS